MPTPVSYFVHSVSLQSKRGAVVSLDYHCQDRDMLGLQCHLSGRLTVVTEMKDILKVRYMYVSIYLLNASPYS
jgi:hypothetical protein